MIRDGSQMTCLSEDLVVGDIIQLCEGDKIPADCLLINGNIEVDECIHTNISQKMIKSVANQESCQMGKQTGLDVPNPILLNSSLVLSG